MQSLKRFATTAIITLAASLTLSGCQMGSFPEASANPEQATLGSFSGSNFGGHAPLVGAHVYVLQPNASSSGSNAYGGQATSILNSTGTANGSNNPTPVLNSSDPNIPTTWYYQKTDLTGAFNITGDYTCTVGLPVYLYLYGGMPQYPSANNVYSIAKILYTGTASPYTVTLTITTNTAQNIENAYTGEYFTISGMTSSAGTPFNGTDQVVVAGSTTNGTNLTTTQFSFQFNSALPSGITTGTTYTETGSNQVTFLPTFNPAVVNLAVLGNCPSGGFTGANAISYVFVNEVSTVAAAYAFRPFTLQGNNDATHIGTSTGNIAGIQNAAVIAKQLYDITGSNVSTTYAGEGHIARTNTVAGNGIVPQANIDTLGNILAACVDSNNGATTVGTSGSYNGTTGAYSGISTQCNTLFTYATNTGIPVGTASGAAVAGVSPAYTAGTQPYDTATAAINIARHPAGAPYYVTGSTGTPAFVTALYNLPTGNVPFAPYLTTQPNDFTIAIDYTAANNPGPDTYPLTTGAESLAIDKIGNVWFTTQPNKGTGAGYLSQVNPAGVFQTGNTQYNSSYIYGYVTIDSGESAWAGSAISSNAVTYVHATSTPAAVSGSAPVTYTYNTGATSGSTVENYTYAGVADPSGNVYFTNNQTAGSNSAYLQAFHGAATTPTVTAIESAAIGSLNLTGQGFSHTSIQVGGASAYFSYNAANGTGTPTITNIIFPTTFTNGVTLSQGTGFPVTNASTGCTSMLDPEQIATNRNGDIMVPDYHNGTGGTTSAFYYINNPGSPGSAGTSTGPGYCTQFPESTFHAGMNYPFGAAVDGNDQLFLTNRGGNTISMFNAGNTLTGNADAATYAMSPATGYEPQYLVGSTLTPMLSNPLNVATGPSGEIWITDYGNNSIIEVIGLGSPTATPLSVAASSSNELLGYRP
jgi:hypothetical protein